MTTDPFLGSTWEGSPMLWRAHRLRHQGAAATVRQSLLARKRAQIGIAVAFLLATLSAWIAILIR